MPIFNRRGSRLTNWRDRLDNPLRVNPEPDLEDDEDDVELGYMVGDRDGDGDIDRRDRRLARRRNDFDGDGDVDAADRYFQRKALKDARKNTRAQVFGYDDSDSSSEGYFEDTAAKFNAPTGLLGAGIGFLFGGPVGAAIGGGLGGFLIKKAE